MGCIYLKYYSVSTCREQICICEIAELLQSKNCEKLMIAFSPLISYFLCCFCSDPYVKLSLYVADENRELALVQTKTIKKVGPSERSGCVARNCSNFLLSPVFLSDLWLVLFWPYDL